MEHQRGQVLLGMKEIYAQWKWPKRKWMVEKRGRVGRVDMGRVDIFGGSIQDVKHNQRVHVTPKGSLLTPCPQPPPWSCSCAEAYISGFRITLFKGILCLNTLEPCLQWDDQPVKGKRDVKYFSFPKPQWANSEAWFSLLGGLSLSGQHW